MSPPGHEWRLRGRTNFRSREASEVDPERARAEWLTIARTIEELGAKVAVLPPDEELTGMPFAAEAGHGIWGASTGRKPRFVLPRMKHVHRQPERDRWAPFVQRLGFETVDIDDGIWEGQGDVARYGDVTFLFFGGRTTREGAIAAGKQFDGEVMFVEVWEPAFHGNMALLPLDHSKTLVTCADVVEDDCLAKLETRFGRDRIHFVSAEEMQHYATNVLPVGDTIIAPTILPDRVKKLFEKQGLKVKTLPMTELCEKAGGAARCLVCRVCDVPEDLAIPEDASVSHWAREIGLS